MLEHQAFAWIKLEEIDQYKFTDATKNVIRKAFEIITKTCFFSDFWDYDGEKTLEKYILKRTGDYNQELFRFRDVKEVKIAKQEAIQYIDYNGYQGQNMLNFYWQYKGKIFSTSFALKYKNMPLKIIESFHYF